MVGFLVTLVKAGMVFALLALTVKMLRRYDSRRFGTTSRKRAGTTSRSRAGSGTRDPWGRSGRARTARWSRAGRPEPILDVVERAPLGRSSSVILVRVQDQHFLFGVTDAQISMLLEVDVPAESDADAAIDLRPDTDQDDATDGLAPTKASLGAASLGATSFSAELLRQARQYLPGASRVEVIDTPQLADEVNR